MRYLLLFAFLLSFLLSGIASGDEVYLINGEVIKGRVEGSSDGKLTIKSPNMDSVTVSLDKIVTFSTVEPIDLHFKDGTVLNKKVDSTSQSGMISIAAGPSGTPVVFPLVDIESINPPAVKWTGNLSAGATITRGNSHTQTSYASIYAVRRSKIDRMTFEGGYASGRQKDPDTGVTSTTQRKSYMGLQYDYFFNKKLYGYANARGERDAVADIDIRFLAGAGGGYQFFEEEEFNLSGEAGITWVSENFYPPTPDEDYFAGRVSYNLNGKFNDKVSYFHKATWYPGFEIKGGHVVNAEAGIRSSLTDSMFTEVKAVWDWDTTPAVGKKRIDVTYLFSFGWSF